MNTKISAIMLIVGLCMAAFIFLMINESQTCSEHVILQDGIEYDCRDVVSHSTGMSRIKLCDGSYIDVPTVRIKQVTPIKNN
jgi:hypothetical protein